MNKAKRNITLMSLALVIVTLVAWLWMEMAVASHRIESHTQAAKAECANAGRTWKECNDFWIASGEYKRPSSEDYSAEWKEFIKAK